MVLALSEDVARLHLNGLAIYQDKKVAANLFPIPEWYDKDMMKEGERFSSINSNGAAKILAGPLQFVNHKCVGFNARYNHLCKRIETRLALVSLGTIIQVNQEIRVHYTGKVKGVTPRGQKKLNFVRNCCNHDGGAAKTIRK